MWYPLPALDIKHNLKAANVKNIFDEKHDYLKWFSAHKNPTMTNPTPLLQELLNAAPKIRALLRNVRSQVRVPQASCSRLPGDRESLQVQKEGARQRLL